MDSDMICIAGRQRSLKEGDDMALDPDFEGAALQCDYFDELDDSKSLFYAICK